LTSTRSSAGDDDCRVGLALWLGVDVLDGRVVADDEGERLDVAGS
jgi:hypothetical protein